MSFTQKSKNVNDAEWRPTEGPVMWQAGAAFQAEKGGGEMNEVQVFSVDCPYCGDRNMHYTAIPDDIKDGKLLECSSCGKRFVVDFALRIEVNAVYTLEPFND